MKLNGFLLDVHPWLGTEHCYREDKGCMNDHTGCMYNDGHNECMHPAKPKYVSPLRVKEKNE